MSRAAQILFLLAERERRTATEVAETLGLPVPTCHHLLNTLAAEGLVTKDSRRQYHLGPGVGLLADAFLRQVAPPEHLVAALHTLAEGTGETAYLSGWRNDEVVVLATVEGNQAVRVAGLHVGFMGQTHARSSGKLLLALAPEPLREAHLGARERRQLTRHTIVREDRLRSELADIRQRRYALDEEEFREGVACVSAPVLDNGLAVAALTVTAPIERFNTHREALIDAVVAAASSLSNAEAGPREATV